MKSRHSYLLSILIVLVLIESCARRGRPEGGEKDLDAPILISASPAHKSINFNKEKIRIYFDEYIKLMELNQQLVISPPMDYQPEITPLGTASEFINIKIIDTLKENTTYTFNFGNSIVDNNEANPLARFKYVFSTGDYIDSLKISGTISDAFNFEVEENISVQLYEVIDSVYTDSIIFNERPSYVGNTLDSTGFEITNLKSGKYLLIALKDVSNNYTFEPKQDLIGYHSSFITLPTDSIFHIKLFREELDFKLMRASEVNKGHIYFGHEGDPKEMKINLISPKPDDFKSALIFEKDMDTVSYWYTPIEADSLLFEVTHQNFIDTLTIRLRSKEVDSLIVSNETNATLKLRDTFTIKTNIPISKIDKTKISIIDMDSLPVTFITYIDPSHKRLKLDFNKQYNNRYNISLLPNSIEDLFGNVNDTLSFNTSTKHPDDFGDINITLQNVESYPIILDLLDNKYNIIESIHSIDGKDFKFNHLTPQDYIIRVIYDTNENKKWDTGHFLRKEIPEKVVYYNTILELRAYWELNETFILK